MYIRSNSILAEQFASLVNRNPWETSILVVGLPVNRYLNNIYNIFLLCVYNIYYIKMTSGTILITDPRIFASAGYNIFIRFFYSLHPKAPRNAGRIIVYNIICTIHVVVLSPSSRVY